MEQKVYLFFQKELILIEIVEKAWYKQNSKHTFTCNLLHSMNDQSQNDWHPCLSGKLVIPDNEYRNKFIIGRAEIYRGVTPFGQG